MPDAPLLEAWFVAEKETKSTVRYQEEAEGYPLIGFLYLKKSAVDLLGKPQRIKIVIQPG